MWASTASLFYLHHLRSRAAHASGNKHTSSPPACYATELSRDFCAGFKPVLQSWLRMCCSGLALFILKVTVCLQTAAKTLVKAVVQDLPSPLVLISLFYIVDSVFVTEFDEDAKLVLAITIIFLACMDWHVPEIVPLHFFVCRILSAMAMFSLCPQALLVSAAFLDPTFGMSVSLGPEHPGIPRGRACKHKLFESYEF